MTFLVSRHDDQNLELKLVEMIHKGKPKKDVYKLVKKIHEREVDYSGLFFKNHFRVDHQIEVTELGFYGPYKEEFANYEVQVEIWKPKQPSKIFPLEWDCKRIGKHSEYVSNAKRREIFYVRFKEPVFIEPNLWYLIQFRLEGPPTFSCHDTFESVPVPIDSKKKKIKFQFHPGSKQMPCLKFKPSTVADNYLHW